MSFIVRRVAHLAFLLFCVSVLSLAIVKLAPGDYFSLMRTDPRISSSTLAAVRSQYGLDKPFPILYWNWLHSVAKGDWGVSFTCNCAAGPILWPRAWNTLILAVCASLLAWLLAVPAGVFAAVRGGILMDLLVTSGTMILLAIPEVVIALLLLLFAAMSHYPLTAMDTGNVGTSANAAELGRRLLLPAICLSAALMPLLVSHIRASVKEMLDAPFVNAARSFGIPSRCVLFRYVLRASLNPVISLFGLSIGLLMSSSLIVEGVFSWPGLGQLMLQAIGDRDTFLIADSAVLSAGLLALGSFVADLLLYVSDPRIRRD